MIAQIKDRFYKVVMNASLNSQITHIEALWLYFVRTHYITAIISFVIGIILGWWL